MRDTGLRPVKADRRDYSLVHTFGAAVDPQGLPADFSIYNKEIIPNQNDVDTRFNPQVPPLPMGCTGETGAFETGLQEGKLYNPKDLYDNTPPGGSGGRDIRDMLKTLIKRGVMAADGSMSPLRTAYFNCYGSGKIDDFDAARIGLWINQAERRGVYIGSWFYEIFCGNAVPQSGIVGAPSFKTTEASLHCYLATGWRTIGGVEYLECLTWQGMKVGFFGVEYFSRAMYNALMTQPYTAAFTITKLGTAAPIAIGWQALVDHLVYFIKNLFNVVPQLPAVEPIVEPIVETPPAPQPTPAPTPVVESSGDKLAEAAVAMLGRDASPRDLAPDELSCAEGVSNIVHSVWPDFPSSVLSTVDLFALLKKSPRFKAVLDPARGCIVVSPTVGATHGHTGIYTQADKIASNDSRTGRFEENYTRASWRSYFIAGKGLKGYLFQPVEPF